MPGSAGSEAYTILYYYYHIMMSFIVFFVMSVFFVFLVFPQNAYYFAYLTRFGTSMNIECQTTNITNIQTISIIKEDNQVFNFTFFNKNSTVGHYMFLQKILIVRSSFRRCLQSISGRQSISSINIGCQYRVVIVGSPILGHQYLVNSVGSPV